MTDPSRISFVLLQKEQAKLHLYNLQKSCLSTILQVLLNKAKYTLKILKRYKPIALKVLSYKKTTYSIIEERCCSHVVLLRSMIRSSYFRFTLMASYRKFV